MEFKAYQSRGRFGVYPSDEGKGWDLVDNVDASVIYFRSKRDANSYAAFCRDYVRTHGDIDLQSAPSDYERPLNYCVSSWPSDYDKERLSVRGAWYAATYGKPNPVSDPEDDTEADPFEMDGTDTVDAKAVGTAGPAADALPTYPNTAVGDMAESIETNLWLAEAYAARGADGLTVECLRAAADEYRLLPEPGLFPHLGAKVRSALKAYAPGMLLRPAERALIVRRYQLSCGGFFLSEVCDGGFIRRRSGKQEILSQWQAECRATLIANREGIPVEWEPAGAVEGEAFWQTLRERFHVTGDWTQI